MNVELTRRDNMWIKCLESQEWLDYDSVLVLLSPCLKGFIEVICLQLWTCVPFYVYVHTGLMYVHRYAPAHHMYTSYIFMHLSQIITQFSMFCMSGSNIFILHTYSVSIHVQPVTKYSVKLWFFFYFFRHCSVLTTTYSFQWILCHYLEACFNV